MEGLETKERTDELLHPFLRAGSSAESENLLAGIISEHAHPIIRNIIKAKLRVSFNQQDGGHLNQDALEIGSEIKGTLLAELQSLKNLPRQKTINNFRNYVAVVTYNACYDYLRRKYPRRHSLKNRLRYLLTHRIDFALWESAEGEWLCGEADWRGRKSVADAERRLRELAQDGSGFVRSKLSGVNAARLELAELLKAVFEELKGPVELDGLATLIAYLQGTGDERDEQTARSDGEEDEDPTAQLPDSRPGVATQVDLKIYLEKLWLEILELPPGQRAAVLLNLKDAQGSSMVEMFPITGIASIRQIAEALEIPAQEFAKLWNELPLDDNKIASRLGINRQQVINLRKSARDRLARRLRDY
jgi:DNA-directed RNA polymerase specialized sigma24 family protein